MHALLGRMAFSMTVTLVLSAPCAAQDRYKPEVGQQGKDVVWVPTPSVLVEKMLDMAKVSAQDVVVDLGSGDGRNVIAAAKRGARARGVEFNEDMVKLSTELAAEAQVGDKATFVQGDMFAADFSDATVLALFLLPDNLDKLRAKFLALKPGTRIVLNTFGIGGWTPDETEQVTDDCVSWCTSLLYYVPAKAAGAWRVGDGVLTIEQDFQKISGSLSAGGQRTPIVNGRLRGDLITFTAGESEYTGRVIGDTLEGTLRARGRTENWRAKRQP